LSVYGWGGKKEPNGMDFYYKRKRNVQRWEKGIWGFSGDTRDMRDMGDTRAEGLGAFNGPKMLMHTEKSSER